MANPILTIIFDIAVIGGTAALFAMAIAEARMERRGAVAASRSPRRRTNSRVAARLAHRPARGKVAA